MSGRAVLPTFELLESISRLTESNQVLISEFDCIMSGTYPIYSTSTTIQFHVQAQSVPIFGLSRGFEQTADLFYVSGFVSSLVRQRALHGSLSLLTFFLAGKG